MGIHYTYKSIRGEKAMKKEAKRKARLEQRRAKKGVKEKNEPEKMHDIEKTITYLNYKNLTPQISICHYIHIKKIHFVSK